MVNLIAGLIVFLLLSIMVSLGCCLLVMKLFPDITDRTGCLLDLLVEKGKLSEFEDVIMTVTVFFLSPILWFGLFIYGVFRAIYRGCKGFKYLCEVIREPTNVHVGGETQTFVQPMPEGLQLRLVEGKEELGVFLREGYSVGQGDIIGTMGPNSLLQMVLKQGISKNCMNVYSEEQVPTVIAVKDLQGPVRLELV